MNFRLCYSVAELVSDHSTSTPRHVSPRRSFSALIRSNCSSFSNLIVRCFVTFHALLSVMLNLVGYVITATASGPKRSRCRGRRRPAPDSGPDDAAPLLPHNAAVKCGEVTLN